MGGAQDVGVEDLGVWAIQNIERSGVPTTEPPSITLSVSIAGWPQTTPSASSVPFRTLMAWTMVSGRMSGRAPSCIAMNLNSGGTASTPCMADSWRSAPEATKSTGVTRP